MGSVNINVGNSHIIWYNRFMQVKEHYHHGALKKTLLAEALHELETDGLEGVSLRKVAETVGVSKTAPYRHFADKRELLVALAADGFRLLAEKLESVLPVKNNNPLEGIRLLFRAYVDFARERPALYKLMISRLGYELHSEACRINSERALGCLIRAVQAAQAAGWRAEKDGMALVLSLWASVHGWAMLLIDNLLPPGIPAVRDNWLSFASALLD